MSDINVRLRNSLIHEKYYIRDDVIHYYFRKQGQTIFETVEVEKLKEINAGNFIRLLVIPVVIALKIVEDEKLLEDN